MRYWPILLLLLAACTSPPPEATPTTPTIVHECDSGICSYSIATPTADLSDNRDEWIFVVLGSDYREGDENRSKFENTDGFIIVSVREEEGKLNITFMPIARELWIPDLEMRINSVYRHLGFEGVRDVVQNTFGLSVDAVLYTDMDRFVNFIDSIHGLKMTLPETVKFQCRGVDYIYQEGETLNFPGEDILCLARWREGSAGYFVRQRIHTYILFSLWDQLLNQVIHEPAELAETVQENRFIDVWPTIEWLRLAKLAIRATFLEPDYEIISLDRQYLELGTQMGTDYEGNPVEYFVQYSTVDLKEWAYCAIRSCP